MTDGQIKSIGHQLQLAARLHRARVAEAIQDLGLFAGQEQVLLALAAGDSLAVGDLAKMLFVRPPTISRTIQRLDQQGLIRRDAKDLDARRAKIALTKEGLRRAEGLKSRLESVESELTDKLDAKDQRRLRKLLKRATKALSLAETPDFPGDADEDNNADD